jgi:nifR3 family TIM-barrel protein
LSSPRIVILGLDPRISNEKHLKPMPKIQNITLPSPLLLAPLAGITDSPFRRLCLEQGAGLVCSEMVSAKGMYYKGAKSFELFRMEPGEHPIAFQIFGSDPEIMAIAAETLEAFPCDIIDINMGCPVPKVVKNGEGSALMKNPKLAADIIKKMTKRTSKPITVKFRGGWDEDSKNAPEFAKAVEQAGAAAVTVHGRTREQMYRGKADRAIIALTKKAVKIPVIGNGDIFTTQDAFGMMEQTGCDAAMIARGAIGNPWIFSGKTPTEKEKRETYIRQLKLTAELKGEDIAVKELRKQLPHYFKDAPGSKHLRELINKATTISEVEQVLQNPAEPSL